MSCLSQNGMVKNTICILLLILINSLGFAQELRVDSLESALSLARPDTSKINLHVELFVHYLKEDIDKAKFHSQEAVKLSEKIKDKRWVMNAQVTRGRFLMDTGLLDSAELVFENILDISKQLKDTAEIIYNHRLIAMANYYQRDYLNGLKHIQSALDLAEKSKLDEKLGPLFNYLGSFYYQLNDTLNAHEYYQYAKLEFEKYNDKPRLSDVLENIAAINHQRGKYDLSILAFKQALEIALEQGDQRSIAHVKGNMSETYLKIGESKESITLLNSAIKINKRLQNAEILTYNYNALANNYSNLDSIDLAITYYQKCIDLALKTKNGLILSSAYDALSQTYEKIGKFRLAYYSRLKLKTIDDSLSNINRYKEFNELNTKYETEKKERIINEQIIKLERQEAEFNKKLATAYLIGSLLIFLFCIFFVKNRLDHLKKSRELLEGKVVILKNQLSPHFLFNSLSVLSTLVYKSPVDADYFLSELSGLYRYILDNIDNKLVLLDEELNFSVSFFNVLKVRFEDCISINVEITEDTRNRFTIPPLTLQTLIENVIKHNKISKECPLAINIFETSSSEIIVTNKINRIVPIYSTQLGLRNLKKFYSHLSDRELKTKETNGLFEATAPIFNIEKKIVY